MFEVLIFRPRTPFPRIPEGAYLVVLHPHVEGLMPGVLDGLRSAPPPQGLRGELSRGHVGGASLVLRREIITTPSESEEAV